MLFEVEGTTVAGGLALAVRGALDVAAAPQLAAAVENALDGAPSALVLDLTRTTFLDSSGARCLVQAAKRSAAAVIPLSVVCPPDNGPVRLVVDLLELGRAMTIVASPGEVATAAGEPEGRP